MPPFAVFHWQVGRKTSLTLVMRQLPQILEVLLFPGSGTIGWKIFATALPQLYAIL
jgi:hypothetical protein